MLRPDHARTLSACRSLGRLQGDHQLTSWCVHDGPVRSLGLPRTHTPGALLRAQRCAGTAERPLLVYLFDPYCPWSYGYLPALTHLLGEIRDEADLEVVNIGLHHGATIRQASVPMLAVQRSTGVGFGPGYRRALSQGSLELNSRDAAAAVIAMTAAAEPSRVPEVLWAVQRSFFWAGRSLSDGATVRSAAQRLGLDGAAVEVFAGSARAAELAEEDFVLARDLGARRGPSLLVSHGDRLCEFEGPGTSGEQLVQQFRSVLARP